MINWSGFESLSGSQEYNFEMLCRSLVWTHYSRFGQFRALANQPGVEFHLKLHTNCSLGEADDWFGWQCRWYGIPAGRAIGTTRRKKIEDALSTTLVELPDITNWVLWTRHPLTKVDQEWFYGLNSKIRLHLWTAADVERLLSGDAEIFKQTYFGDLVLTSERLAQLHEISVEPIKERWLPEAHQPVDAERELRKMLVQLQSWDELESVAQSLLQGVAVIKSDPKALSGLLVATTTAFIQTAELLAETMNEVYFLLAEGDLELLSQRLEGRLKNIDSHVKHAPRRLRNARLSCGLYATNALADIKLGIEILNQIDSFLGQRLVAVVADAGGGKTQLAAELTLGRDKRPAGILLLGRDLSAGKTLDDLAKKIVINGSPLASMPALLAALNAAGQRARCRLPIVIDGLNEAEDPRDWKRLLAALASQLRMFTNVLVVCTLRTGARKQQDHHWHRPTDEESTTRMTFADQSLPAGIKRIEIPDFGEDSIAAVGKYFDYFRIKGGDADLPLDLLKHPLTLRIFCEVTNPTREHEVGVEEMPRSLSAMFERYISQASGRIADLAPRTNRYYEHDVSRTLNALGVKLWDTHKREIAEDEFRKQIGDDRRSWDGSIVRLLEQEGMILRVPGTLPGELNIIPVYDLLGGYLIANAIVSHHGSQGLAKWISKAKTISTLVGGYPDQHPLADDIFRALVGLIPQKLNGQQLWQLVKEPLRSSALELVTTLEGRYVDAATVSAVLQQIKKPSSNPRNFFVGLISTRSAIRHPLNASFLNSTLESMAVGERDLKWTEWIRRNKKWFLDDVQAWATKWKDQTTRTEADSLRATWFMWLLTTTIHKLRDQVTYTLYWFGRGDADALFNQTARAAGINDPYVFERMMAASYGVAMALCSDTHQPYFKENVLPQQAMRLYDLMFKEDAPFRTTHALTRDYARHFLELASFHNPTLFSPAELIRIRPPFVKGGDIEWQKVKVTKRNTLGISTPFRMDFENYTLGGLVKDRHNYDYSHADYQKVRSQVLWRVEQLGWSATAFKEVDSKVAAESETYSRHDHRDYEKIDRYGKKYSWIAYFELYGWRQDSGLLGDDPDDMGRSWEADIDPSFPSPIETCKLVDLNFLGDSGSSLNDWIKHGPQPNLEPFFVLPEIQNKKGPWVLLDGYISQQDENLGRSMFAFVRTLLVAQGERDKFIQLLKKQRLGGRWLPEKPEFYRTFSGEIPWSDTFPKTGNATLEFVTKEERVPVKREEPQCYLDGKKIEISTIELLLRIPPSSKSGDEPVTLTEEDLKRIEIRYHAVEAEETRRITYDINVVIPVCEINLTGRPIEAEVKANGVTLCRDLAELAKLIHIPQTHDLQTKNAKRATLQTAYRPEAYHNGQRFFFVQEDILRECLDKLGLSLVWAVWGERDLSVGQFHKRERNHDFMNDLMREDFQSVYAYNNKDKSASSSAPKRKNKI